MWLIIIYHHRPRRRRRHHLSAASIDLSTASWSSYSPNRNTCTCDQVYCRSELWNNMLAQCHIKRNSRNYLSSFCLSGGCSCFRLRPRKLLASLPLLAGWLDATAAGLQVCRAAGALSSAHDRWVINSISWVILSLVSHKGHKRPRSSVSMANNSTLGTSSDR